MRNFVYAVFLLLLFSNTQFAQFSLNIYPDKEEYSYGETIIIHSRLKNISDSTITVRFGCQSSMQAEFFLDDFSSFHNTVGLATQEEIIFHPGTERIYKWIIDPHRYGLPKFSGSHKLVGYHTHFYGLTDSVFFNAPKYYGGYINIDYNTVNKPVVDSIITVNNFTVLDSASYSFNSSSYAKLDIAGHSLDSTITALLESGLFNSVEPDLFTEYESAYITSVDQENIREDIEISNAYPNPFNPSTHINYSIPLRSNVEFSVYNIQGELVEKVVLGNQNSGSHEIVWNGKNQFGQQVTSGVYLYRIIISHSEKTSDKRIKSGKLLLLK